MHNAGFEVFLELLLHQVAGEIKLFTAWFLETRLLHTVQVPDDFRSTFEKNVLRPEVVEHHLWFTINHDAL